MKWRGILGGMWGMMTGVVLSGCAMDGAGGGAENGGEVSFTREVKPILERRCLPCHNGSLLPGLLDMRSREAVFVSRPGGAVIVPGDPEASRFFHKMSRDDDEEGAMPPTGHALSAEEQEVLMEWIRQGAAWPEGRAGELRAKEGAEPRST